MMPGMMGPGAATGRFQGRIKSFNVQKGFGFIECAEAHQVYGRDVFLHKAQIGDFEIGRLVSFAVEMNKNNMPQARDLTEASDFGLGGFMGGMMPGAGMMAGGRGGAKGAAKGRGRGSNQKKSGADAKKKAGGEKKPAGGGGAAPSKAAAPPPAAAMPATVAMP